MENINVDDSLFMMVGILQHVFVPLFAVLALVGLFFFNVSFKNPMKRRVAFLLTFFAPIGFVVFLFGPTILISELFQNPSVNESGAGLEVMAGWADSARSPVYFIFTTLSLIAIMSIYPIGIGLKYMAFRAPALGRIGSGMIIGATLFWVLLETGPSILRVLTTL